MPGIIQLLLLAMTVFLGGCERQTDSESSSASSKQQRPEAYTLDGRPLYQMTFDPETKARLESNLAVARAVYDNDPSDSENIIWLGRRLAYLTRYQEAIRTYSAGLELYPDNYKLLRHRGHRYISIRDFDRAIADFEKASRLIEGIPDEIEPDGQPNRFGIPTSTSHSNIWYHLGLAYYLKGDFENAVRAYRECLTFSNNPDMLVATTDWLYMALRRLGREQEAQTVLEPIHERMEILENHAYHRRLLLYKGLLAAESLLNMDQEDALQLATYGYGIGNWFLVNGDTARAVSVFKKVVQGTYWPAFGYIAAEADLHRLGQD